MVECIGALTQDVPTCGCSDQGETVFKIFEADPSVEGVVVLDRGKPAGLLMRNHFYQTIGKQFGREIFLGRAVELMMNREILAVDVSVDIAEVGLMAVSRPQESRYDFVLATDQGRYAGAVSISLFLVELHSRREREIDLLRQKQEILERANAAEIGHRLVIEGKNKELTGQKAAIKNLLDNAGQGFLSFGADLLVQEGSSRECTSIFGFDVPGRGIIGIFKDHVDADTLSSMREVFHKVFELAGSVKRKVYLSLLPGEVMIREKTIRIEYKALQDEQATRIMLILTDITEKKKLEARMLAEQKASHLILTALTKYNDLVTSIEGLRHFFSRDIHDMLANKKRTDQFVNALFRMVHTFKGDFSQLHMSATAAGLHELENQIAAMVEHYSEIPDGVLAAFIAGIDGSALLERDISVVKRHLGGNYFNKSISFNVTKEKIIEIEHAVCGLCDSTACSILLPQVKMLRYENLKNVVMKYDGYIQSLAQKFGKNVHAFSVHGDDIFVDTEDYQPFIKALVHVFRNALDHGIETVEERDASGKDITGTIACRIHRHDGARFTVSIYDDGRGLDIEKIKARALELGMGSREGSELPDVEALQDCIFLDRFSTKEAPTMISGRGVGLSAVKAIVEQFGGTVSVKSARGQSTELCFSLPLPEDQPTFAHNSAFNIRSTADISV